MIRYRCPRCGATLLPDPSDAATSSRDPILRCPNDGYLNEPEDGVRDFLSTDEETRHARFVEEYRAIRQSEHRGSDDPAHYLALPDVPDDDPRNREWRMRKESAGWLWEQMERWSEPRRRKVLDAGAGNCWLTRWIAEWGNDAVALDLNLDTRDGLLAGRHYLAALPIRFDRVRADFTHLPFPDGELDAIVFNGAFHYGEDRDALVAEALRALRDGGAIYIIDSPVYRDRASGEKMLAERGGKGRAGFLTFGELDDLAHRHHLSLELHHPYLGPLSKLKRRITELRMGREIATMTRVKLLRLTIDD